MIQQSSLKSTFRSDPGADVQQPDAGHHLRRRRPHVRALQRAERFPTGQWPTYRLRRTSKVFSAYSELVWIVGSQFSDFFKTPEKESENCWLSISNTVPFSKFLEPIALDTLVRGISGAWGACSPVRALRT